MRIALLAATALSLAACGQADAAAGRALPSPAIDPPNSQATATAVFAGGCFWGVEAVFEHVRGVRSVVSGYAGGTKSTATYDAVSTERTRHAEAVRITYDPRQVSYGTLLKIYFQVAHDPTQFNRQGPDTGPSYRSAIFPQSPEQVRTARSYIAQLGQARAFRSPIVTKLENGTFYPAESYHQDFMRRNPAHPYILAHDVSKVRALKAQFPQLFRG